MDGNKDIYKKLSKVLDTLPNGFPETESGVEIKLLKKIFTPEEADLFCDLRLSFETPEQVAERTGRPLEGLSDRMKTMWQKGQLFGVDFGEAQIYKMLPWVFGIYEFQLKRMDREFAELCDEYTPVFGKQFFENTPQLMQVIPIENEIQNTQAALPFEKASTIIEKGKSFAVNECICKKEKALLDQRCDKPLEVCMGIAPVPGVFEGDNPWGGRVITKEEAYKILQDAEEAGLVHMTSNVQDGQFYICNCCGCCCGVLRSINELGVKNAIHSNYYAVIDPDLCDNCGLCASDRCQIEAIREGDTAYEIIKDKCIGCGLCITTCPAEAIRLERKPDNECITPPTDEEEWYKKRADSRGIDYSNFA
jgi:NAD-dependent dihydropyrimidine dehydrogenase PreA subunit